MHYVYIHLNIWKEYSIFFFSASNKIREQMTFFKSLHSVELTGRTMFVEHYFFNLKKDNY